MATPAPRSTPGNMASFNILHGYPEALVRGMRSSFLADADYHHLTQCETLDDVRLNLSETDYGDVLADMNTLIPTRLQKAAVDKVRIIHLRVGNYQCYVLLLMMDRGFIIILIFILKTLADPMLLYIFVSF